MGAECKEKTGGKMRGILLDFACNADETALWNLHYQHCLFSGTAAQLKEILRRYNLSDRCEKCGTRLSDENYHFSADGGSDEYGEEILADGYCCPECGWKVEF